MPHSTNWERAGVLWTFRGVVTGDELLEANRLTYGDRRFDLMKYQIADMTGVERFDVSEDDMLMMAASDRAAAMTNPNVRVAVVATDAIVLERSLLYRDETVRSPWEQRIFALLPEARAWVTRS